MFLWAIFKMIYLKSCVKPPTQSKLIKSYPRYSLWSKTLSIRCSGCGKLHTSLTVLVCMKVSCTKEEARRLNLWASWLQSLLMFANGLACYMPVWWIEGWFNQNSDRRINSTATLDSFIEISSNFLEVTLFSGSSQTGEEPRKEVIITILILEICIISAQLK